MTLENSLNLIQIMSMITWKFKLDSCGARYIFENTSLVGIQHLLDPNSDFDYLKSNVPKYLSQLYGMSPAGMFNHGGFAYGEEFGFVIPYWSGLQTEDGKLLLYNVTTSLGIIQRKDFIFTGIQLANDPTVLNIEGDNYEGSFRNLLFRSN